LLLFNNSNERKKMIPDSLAIDIANENVSWENSQTFSTVDFFTRYTLHDSHWLGLYIDTSWDGDATAIIAFDPIWNQIEVPKTPTTSKWPILLIRFPTISAINIADYKDIGGVQRGIAKVELEAEVNDRKKTIISDHYGGKVIISHQDPVKVLCFASTGERIGL
jgi:hypothetical protein